MRSAISVDDGSDGCISCVGLELPKDKMYRIAGQGGILKDSQGQIFDKTQFVFRAGTSSAKAKSGGSSIDANLEALAIEAAGQITDNQVKPVTETSMSNLSEVRKEVLALATQIQQGSG